MPTPKISVLMPVYKTDKRHLKEAIESILQQTFSDFEFLILDDCPEDSREDVVKSFNDKRIKYFKNEKNLGITKARNKLIDMAKGEYLAVFDHDDLSMPTRFEKQVQFLDENADVGVVGCNIESFPQKRRIKQPIENHEIKLALMTQCVIAHSSAMIRKQVLVENNVRYREEYSPSEDYALWCDLIKFTNFHNIPEVLFKWRDHKTNTSKTQDEKMKEATLRIHAEMQTNFPALYNEFLLKATQKRSFYLLGFIPLVRFETIGYKTKVLLFNKILIATYKKSIKLKGV